MRRWRVREKQLAPFQTHIVYNDGEFAVPIESPTSSSLGSTYSRFEDVVGSISSWQNPCLHVSIETNIDIEKCKALIGEVEFSRLNWPDDISVTPHAAIEAACPYPSSADVAEATIWARVRSISAVDAEADLLAFIGELKESLSGIITKGSKFLTMVDRLYKTVRKHYERIRKQRLDLSDLACWNLAWQFGLKPFLADLQTFFGVYEKAVRRLNWLHERNGKPTYVKNRRKLPPQTGLPLRVKDLEVRHFGSNLTAHEAGYMIVHKSSKYRFASTQCVRFDIPPELLEPSPFSRGIVLLDMLGVYNPISSAWELTRFSWLIDWFVGYRQRVTARELSLSPLKDATYLASVSSIREEHEGFIYFKPGWPCQQGTEPLEGEGPSNENPFPCEWIVGDFKMTRYTRVFGDFSTDDAPHLNIHLTLNKLGILASILIQRFYKRRK